MKVKTLSALAGIGATMILSGQANAAFTGLSVVKHTTVTLGGVPRDVYRLYANFDNAADQVQSVFGEPPVGGGADHPLTIQNTNALGNFPGTNFFDGGSDASPTITASSSPAVRWATFYTIGTWEASQGQVAAIQNSPNGFIVGNQLTSNNVAWFVTDNPLSSAAGFAGDGDATLRVGLAQLTVNLGENVRGTIALQINPGGALAGGTQKIYDLTFDSFIIPAPGALALLGLAGLVGSRRRRA